MTKKNKRSDIQIDPVFSYLVSEIGESRDVYRFDIEQNDLNEATTLYNFFKGNKSSFSTINKDPRCKIVPIDDFKPEANWSVDRWWSMEEKIALGIEEEIKVLDVLGFSSLVSDIADTLGGFSTMLKEVGEKKKSTTIIFKKIILNEIIDFSRKTNNSQFTKAFVEKNKGEVPVYSASDDSNLIGYGYVQDNLPRIKYFQNCMTWNIDGSIGQVFIRKGRFTLSEKVIPLILLEQYENQLDKSFIKHAIEQQAKQEGFGFSNKAGKAKLAKMTISIPLNSDGAYDLEAQQDIVEKYNVVSELKAKVDEHEKKLKNLTVLIENEVASCKVVKIGDIFETQKGLTKYTKTYGQLNIGDFPVYSGSTNAPIMHIKSYDHSGEVLSWVVDGLAGYMQVLSGKFSATGHRGVMFLKVADIDIYYVKNILEPVLRELAKGRKGDKGKNEYTNVAPSVVESVTIPIPILSNGNFDITRQNEIAESYRKIEEVKYLLLAEFKKIKNISIKL